MSSIHPTAIIEEGAQIGKDCLIEAYAIIKRHVILKDRVQIKSHAYIDGHTMIDEATVVWPGASIGTMTQDLKFKGETTYVKIGKRCQIREFVTINSSTGEGDTVSVGDDCLIMAYCHVAHNCVVGNHVIMSNGATLAGHVIVEDHAIIGGMTPIHQFARVGTHAMVGGMSRVTHDIPPYTVGGGVPYKLGGINLVGLKRRGFTQADRSVIASLFNITYRLGHRLEEALERIQSEHGQSPWAQNWIKFCRESKRGLIDLSTKVKEKVACE